jgi:2-dehydro-3-deoxyphosphooctonate aldolase (KDO 8-P synthase)
MNNFFLNLINTPFPIFFLIAGPCVIENYETSFSIAQNLKETTEKLGIPFIFKASFDKANRTSIHSFRGPGFDEGLDILNQIKTRLKVPVLSDIHLPDQAEKAAQVLDVIHHDISITERGSSFGYNNLVVDFRSIHILREMGIPVIFDATHSVQLPGGGLESSAGESKFVPTLSKAAIAAGAHGLFIETHPEPEKALCDGPNSMPLDDMETLLSTLMAIKKVSG